MPHVLSLGEITDGEELRKPINDLCLHLKLQGAIRLVSEFSSGFTNTRVFLAEVRASPSDPHPYRIVFKTGPSGLLFDEAKRFQAFIPHARAHASFAKLLHPDRTLKGLSRDESLGAIAYDYAPAPLARNECASLGALAEKCVWAEDSIDGIREVIATTVSALASLYAESKPDFSYRIARYYLERWVPDFTLSVERAVRVPGSYLLTLDRFQPEHFLREPLSNESDLRRLAESPPGTQPPEIRMKRLRPAYWRGNRVYLHAPHADDLSIEVAIDALEARDRKAVVRATNLDIWAPAGLSRYQFYRRRLATAFPDFDLDCPTFSIGAACFHNPLRHLSQPFVQLAQAGIDTRLGPAHGDLHPGNVLVVGTAPVIIDYGLSEESLPVGVDAARLLGGLVRGACARLPLHELADVVSEAVALTPCLPSLEGPSDRARQLLKILSDETARISGDTHAALWPYHLYGLGWIGLKWTDGTTDEYRASFLLSAIALTKLLGRPGERGPALDGGGKRHVSASPALQAVAIKPEGPAEILVIVAQFEGRGDFDPTARIYGSLADHVHELIPTLGRVERVAASVASRKDALALASQYKASMIVWGSYDSFGVSPRYDVTRDSLVMRRVAIQLDQATRHSLGERFEPYITHGLTEEVSFLSLVAIGEMCLLNLSYEAAISVFERALTLVPDKERAAKLGAAKVYGGLSGLLATTRRNDEALVAIAKARELNPSNVAFELQELVIRSGIGQARDPDVLRKLREVAVRRIRDAGDDADSLRKFVDVIDSVKNPVDLVRRMEEMRRPDSALRTGKGVRPGNKDVIVHVEKAGALLNQGHVHAALTEAKKALRLNPRSAEALFYKANATACLGGVEAARRDLEMAERINPQLGAIHALRGIMLWYSDRLAAETVAAFEKAYDLGFPNWPPDVDRFEALVSLGRDDDVMKELKHGVLDPTAPGVFIARSMCYQRRGELPLALSEVSQAMSLWESDRAPERDEEILPGWLHVRRGEVRWAMGDRQGALADLEYATQVVGEFVLVRNNFQLRLDELKVSAS